MLTPNYDHEIPKMTVEVAKAAFPKGNGVMKIRDELGPLFEDAEFVALYPKIGQPAESPARLALVTILQFMENLTDREAADAVRSRIDWKYLLGLELTDAGFHYSVLSEFRQRLLERGEENILLNRILEQCISAGLLKGQSKQRTDSTRVIAKIRSLNRVELAGETMRRVLDDIAQVAPTWLKDLIKEDWGKRYGSPLDTHNIRKSKGRLEKLAQTIGEDGHYLLAAIYQEDTPIKICSLFTVEVLRQVWVQQYYLEGGQSYWRKKDDQGFPTSGTMIASPDDLDARYSSKYGAGWIGYKLHITETCDPEEPRLITQVTTTTATVPDSNLTEAIQEDLVSRDLSPDTHWVDAGYVNTDNLLSSQEKEIDLLGPARGDSSWQARTDGGYDQTKFIIDWENMVATCPEGQQSMFWKDGKSSWGRPNIHFLFSRPLCFQCSAREKCSRGKKNGRHLTVSPRPAFEMLRQAREREQTEAFKEEYKRRAGVEGTIAQVVNAMGARHNRYRGLARTRLQHLATAAAINIRRIAAWLMGDRPGGTRISPFAMLAAPL
jgi:transposase